MIRFNTPDNMQFSEALNAALDIAGHVSNDVVHFEFNGFGFYVTKESKNAIAPRVYSIETEPGTRLIDEIMGRLEAKVTETYGKPPQQAYAELKAMRSMLGMILL